MFTPLPLVHEMLDAIETYADKDFWKNPKLKILDPAAGIGNFPLIAFEKLMKGLESVYPSKKARKRHILEKLLYMVELNSNNVRLMRKIFGGNTYKLNIIQGDFLAESTQKKLMKQLGGNELKFDLVMGNPPYQKGKNSNFYTQFMAVSKSLTLPSSIISFLVPNRILIPSHEANKIAIDLDLRFVKHTVKDMQVSTDICYFIAFSTTYQGKTRCMFSNNVLKTISLYMPTPTSSSDYIVKKISDKILSNALPKLTFQSSKPTTSHYIFIKRQWERYSPSKPGGDGNHVFANSDNEKDGKFISATNLKWKNIMLWYLTRSKVIHFVTAVYASSMNVPPFLWQFIPCPETIEQRNDLALLNEFGITQDELQVIDSYTK